MNQKKATNNSNRIEFRGNAEQINKMRAMLKAIGVREGKFFNKCIQDYVEGRLVYNPDTLELVAGDR